MEDFLCERGEDISYEAVRYCWQSCALNKALDKLVNVCQPRSFGGMQRHGIVPLIQGWSNNSVVKVGILENFLQNFLWGLFGLAHSNYTALYLP